MVVLTSGEMYAGTWDSVSGVYGSLEAAIERLDNIIDYAWCLAVIMSSGSITTQHAEMTTFFGVVDIVTLSAKWLSVKSRQNKSLFNYIPYLFICDKT